MIVEPIQMTCFACTELLEHSRIMGDGSCNKHGRYAYYKRYHLNGCSLCAKETGLCANCGKKINENS
jgi:hypothetical protein